MSPERQDGRILPATHWASLAIFVILVPALVVLWGLPMDTGDTWAWMLKPDLSPIFLGAGYGAVAYFFLRTFLADRWPPSSAGVFGAAFFATLMLIATLLHWDRFNQGNPPTLAMIAFYGWVIVYVVSPFAVAALWWRNRRTDSGEPLPGEPAVPRSAACRAALRRRGVRGRRRLLRLPGHRDRPLAVAAHAADLARARRVHGPGRRWGAAALHRRPLGLVAADRGDVLRRGRAAARRRRPRLVRLRRPQPAHLSHLGGLAGQALALAVLYRRMERARQRPSASGGAQPQPLGAARARPGA